MCLAPRVADGGEAGEVGLSKACLPPGIPFSNRLSASSSDTGSSSDFQKPVRKSPDKRLSVSLMRRRLSRCGLATHTLVVQWGSFAGVVPSRHGHVCSPPGLVGLPRMCTSAVSPHTSAPPPSPHWCTTAPR